MAQCGESWSDEEDGDDVEDSAFVKIMFPYIADFKKEGDKQFKAKEFQQAAETYSVALHWPISRNVDFSIIGEHLFRKRAACYFRLGEYSKAIEDSDRAIELAPLGEKRKIAESIFIKTKAIACIGDLVGALPLAVWCKFLKPKSLRALDTLRDIKERLGDAFKKNETLVHDVLETVLGFAEVMESDDATREIALDCYTELIALLDFLLLHGVLFKRASCLLKLGRCTEAKEDCEKALWKNPDNSKYLELMHEIIKRLKESESKARKEKRDSKEKSPMREVNDSALPKETIPLPEDKKQDAGDSRSNFTSDAAFEEIIKPGKPDDANEAQTSKSIGSKKKKRKKKKGKPKKTGEKREKVSTSDNNVTSQRMDAAFYDVVADSDCSQDTDVAKGASGSVLDGSRSLKDEECSNEEPSVEECMIPSKRCQAAPDLKSNPQEQLLEHFSRNDDENCMKTAETSQWDGKNADELQSSSQSHQSNTKELLLSASQNVLKNSPQHNSETYSKPMETLNGIEIQTTIPSTIRIRESPVTGAVSAIVPPSESPTKVTSFAHELYPNPARSTATFHQQNCWEMELPPCDRNSCRVGAISEDQMNNRALRSQKNGTNNAFLRMSETNKEAMFRSSRMDDLDAFPILPQGSLRSGTEFCSKPPTWNKTPPMFEKPSQRDNSQVNSSSNFQNLNDRLLSQKLSTHQLSNAPSPKSGYIYAAKINSSNSQKVEEELCGTKPIDSFRSTISAGKPACSNSKTIKAEACTGNQEASEVSRVSPDPRKLPSDVFVLCDHFLEKNNKRSASIFEKTKACKGCENRSKLKYGTWNDSRKEWQIMRSYPKAVPLTAAFQLCSHFPTGRRCRKEPCSFAHGKQELTVWTMDREGILPSPRETLIGLTQRTRPLAQVSLPAQTSRQLRYRPSPPGVTDGSYRLCKSVYTHERCRFGRGCLFAHSKEELQEWIQEFQKKEKEKLRRELEGQDEVTTLEMASQILKGPSQDLTEFMPGVGITCTPGYLDVKLTEGKECKWTFTLDYKTEEVGQLKQVLLVHRYHNTYRLREISVGYYRNYGGCEICLTTKLNDLWYRAPNTRITGHVKVTLKVSFESSLFGSFQQWVLFDFGRKPYLIQKLNADVVGSLLLNEQTSVRNNLASHQWDECSVQVVKFGHGTKAALHNEHLSRFYSLPKEPGNLVSTSGNTEALTSQNYKDVMHQLLFLEELYMKKEISSYLLNGTQLHAQWNIFDEMSGMRCAVDGELFGVLHLQEEDALRPDDAAGRLLYRNVDSVWLQLCNAASNKVYEAPVEKVESECVVLRLSSKMCTELNLFDTCDVDVNAQFQLSRSPLCQMHAAIDRLTERQMCILFPKPRSDHRGKEVHIRWQWLLDSRLNMNQKKVIERIATPEYNALPLVVFGPFGTGKTFTLNQSVRLLVQVDKSHRILLCTHSNRAADNHVELLHTYLTENNGVPAAKPLRVYQPMRRLETASEIARKYCLIKDDIFVLPTRDDVVQHRVVVTTLSTSHALLDLQLFHGFFTHILVDEAAQALEPETLTPLFLAGPTTKVVLTGDHMQMSPEVYSQQARKWGLHKSLAERLFDHYDKDGGKMHRESNVLFLTENYRCHLDILQFPSDNFYGEKLVARGHAKQPAHPTLGPLLFFSARGKETKEQGHSYMNLSEVYEVVKRVKELVDTWPTDIWGPRKVSEIAVLSAYRYQVQAIRNNLRKDRELKDVKVDTIHNVQGEEFRALFISTVRTFHTCKPQQDSLYANGSEKQLYWEFLSDPKLLNTAVTRARCLVAVVGDPVSLCTLGECRGLWRDFIKRCSEKGGLYGTKMKDLEKEINACIASIQLNPEAELFVPRKVLTQNTGLKQEETKQDYPESFRHQSAYENQLVERDQHPSYQHPHTKDVWSKSFRAPTEDVVQDLPLSKCQPPNQDEEPEATFEEDNDFPDYLLEDATVFPKFMDEIIQAFVAECEETLNLDATNAKLFEDDEFPTLQSVATKHPKTISNVREPQLPAINERVDIKDLLPEVRLVNGRVEVRLVNLGFYRSPSDRATRVMVSSKHQDFLDPSVLRRLVQEEPDRYVICNLRMSPEKSEVAYAEVEDTSIPDILIKGRVRQAFHKDKVVVKLFDKKMQTKGESSVLQAQGKVVGVLEHIISPHERQYVCTTDYENPAVMVPINKSATNLVNMTDKSCKDIPIYRKEKNNNPTKVRMMKREEVLSGKYLFVVKYLCWRREFSYPLGFVVRTLPRGEDVKSSMEILYAEHGVRRAFLKETSKYVKEKFPQNWSIPEEEYCKRTKIFNAFTIDPPASVDLDDALSVEITSPSSFLVGVHIADVTFFLECGTPLDHEAFLRCTSYYPGQGDENVPMLPRELSENYCSLLPEQDRLAVTVFVPLDNEGNIAGEVEIKRTVVRSCCRLDYSEAQLVISGIDVTSIIVSQEVKASIKTLSCLAQKRRKIRLGDSSFDHWQNEDHGNDFEAHELVEEMMILANQEIARFLSANVPEEAPLRIQLPPKDHRMAEWIETHGRYLKFSNQVSRIFNKGDSDKVLRTLNLPPNMNFKIKRSVWYEIFQAAESRDLPKLRRLICNESNHPQIATANSHFHRVQSESRYVCQGDQPTKNIMHFSLGMGSYTHFTSPIRRYIDVVVHRLVLGLISNECIQRAIVRDEIANVCRRSTFSQENARRFNKACKRIQLAALLQQRSRESLGFVESIDKKSLTFHFPNREDDVLEGRQKRLLISHLNPVAIEENLTGEREEEYITLRWKSRMYKAPDEHDDASQERNLLASNVHIEGLADVPSNVWHRVLDTVKSGDENKLITLVKETEVQLRILQSSIGNKTSKGSQVTPRAIYKHPYHDQSVSESNETEGHFYEKSLPIKKFDYFQMQLTSRMIRGILSPDIQVLNVNSRLGICIEHQRYPRDSFTVTARHQASRDRYETIEHYIAAWKPVLSMEAATQAVKEDGGFTIEGLSLKWERSDKSTLGFFILPLRYCDSCQLKFYLGDFACIRMPYSETENVHEATDNVAAYCGPGGSASCVWVAHCIIKDVNQVNEEKAIEVIVDLHQASSHAPQELFDGNCHRSTFHLIHRTLPHRRMYSTLCDRLRNASKLARAICKGEEPDQGHCGNKPTADLSVASHHMSCKLQRLDPYQETAVEQALSKPFTLIQGPPGTGKTVTGVHIAYWFAKRNRELKLPMPMSCRESQETKGITAFKAPAQIIYCGPSNKSVDVVTEYLLRISGLKLVRVYSDVIERRAFPVPNEVKPARGTRSEDDLRIESDQIKLVSLHHMIRRHDCPYSSHLRQSEEKFAKDKQRGVKTSKEEVSEYCKLIGQAERWVLQESGVQIILCTCAVAGSPRINLCCDNIQQCIVDECGMCLEPESLIPIACSGARQVILIGDHKQLQPIIQDKVARSLGLNVSMFERLSKRAIMLELQYRMHSSICEFPSRHFYQEKLKTADVVKSRDPGPVSFWPAQIRRKKYLPLVFCHVEGLEEAATISTAESNEESKRNMKEARKAVNVAKYIVNHYRRQVRMSDVVILSPYREQCSKIRELLMGAYEEIQVTTITKSQGSEWDYVIISLVRSLKKDDLELEPSLQWLRRQLGFLTDEHQINVGLTRARKGLCIIGNKHLLSLNPMWQSLLKHYEENGCIVDDSWPWT